MPHGREFTKNKESNLKKPMKISLDLVFLLSKPTIFSMNRLKNFVEWNAFGVCSSIGDRLHISPCRIRQYFIYSSVLTMGSPIIVYMVLAFWKNMKNYIWSSKRNPWYYL